MKENKTKRVHSILTYHDSESTIATEFRRIYSNIRAHNPGQNPRTLLITSSVLGEGKSTIAALLAINVAQRHNEKVLLLDADLRRATIHRFFALNRIQGLAEVLEGEIRLKESIKSTDLDNLKVITAGKRINNPSELLETSRLKQLVDELKAYFDLVIVDCAPVIPVSDALILGQELEGVLLVLKAGATQREVVKRARDLLSASNLNVVGIIMNNMKESLPYYYDYKYYGYEYGSADRGKEQ